MRPLLTRGVPILLAALVAAPAIRAADAPPPLDEAMFRASTDVWKALKGRGAKAAGVLKFLASRDGAAASDRVGTINQALADRLETALIVGAPDASVMLLRRAGVTAHAQKLRGHLTPEGRKAFFEVLFEPAWGASREPVPATHLLTGTAAVSVETGIVTVTVQAFGADGALEDVARFDARLDARLLAEAGYAYAVTPAEGEPVLAARGKVRRYNQLPKLMPVNWNVPENAVTLEVRYDGTPVAPEVPAAGSVGESAIREPKSGEAVEFVLTNTTDRAQGVVLKVNGESAYERERTADLRDLRKWVIPPKETLTLKGFYSGTNRLTPFRVMSDSESAESEVNYAPDAVGLIQMMVVPGKEVDEAAYKAATAPKAPPAAGGVPESARLAIARGVPSPDGVPPDRLPGTLSALQSALRRDLTKAANLAGRGLVAAGTETADANIRRTFFLPDSETPHAVVTVRYYRARPQ